MDRGPHRGLGQREPGSGPPGLSHSRIERHASLRHAARPRVRGRQFASGREAALPGGHEALGGLERLPLTRGKEGDPRASFPQAAATRSLARPTGSGYSMMCRAGATHHSLLASATHLPSGGCFGTDAFGTAPEAGVDPKGFSSPSTAHSFFSGSSTPCSRGRLPKIFSKLGNPYFRMIGPLMMQKTPHRPMPGQAMYNTLLKLSSQNGKEEMADGLISSARSPAICHLPFAICHFLFAFLDSVDPVDADGRESCSDYLFAWPSAKAWSKSRPGDLKPIFSLTKRAASDR